VIFYITAARLVVKFRSDASPGWMWIRTSGSDERAMAWPSSVAHGPSFRRNCSALMARSGPTSLAGRLGHAFSFLAAASRRGKRTRGGPKVRRPMEPGSSTVFGAGGGLLWLLSASELDA